MILVRRPSFEQVVIRREALAAGAEKAAEEVIKLEGRCASNGKLLLLSL